MCAKLEVTNLNFAYGTEPILKDLSFSLSEGEFVSILGPSGCGKSTLLNVLAGTLEKQGGSISIDDNPVMGMPGKFAYMPQDDLLLPWRTIQDNVCLYAEIHHDKKQVLARAKEQLAVFGLAGCEDKYPEELSGGMRQRAAFLRTALCEAEIYLLDEPFGALDVITRGDMQDWLRELCARLNKTILLVTHDTDEAIYLSDRILIFGNAGEGIRREITISDKERSKDWLYAQGELRSRIHRIIQGGK